MSVQYKCHVSNLTSLHLSLRTVWRKGKSGLEHWGIGAAQRVRCPHSEVGAGDYSLYIKEVREEDSGNYTCTVQDGEKILSKRILLRVIKGKELK